MKKGKPSKKPSKKLDLLSIQKAARDPKMRYRLSQKNNMPAIITGQDKVLIKQFARITLPVATQRDSKMTQASLEENIVKVLKKVKPDMRKMMITQMKEYVSEQA